MLDSLHGRLRATGADLPWGDPLAAHPGVALESCFWRLVAPDERRVVLLAVTVVRDAAGESWASTTLAGLDPDGSRSVAHRILGDVEEDRDGLGVRAGRGALSVSRERLRVDLGARARLDVALEQPWRWPRRSLGGLGLGHLVPGLSQYWHPHLLGARVRGSMTLDDDPIGLDGATAYGEKNWGRGGFPRAWWWGQATTQPDVVVAFAGGILDAAGLGVGATAITVRLGDELATFAPGLAVVRARVDATRWAVDAMSPRWRVEVRATADGEPFDIPVPVPGGARRTAPLSHQHQDGHLELVVWRRGRVVHRGRSELAGLERGGRALDLATG